MREFLESNLDDLVPMLFRGRRSYSLKDRPLNHPNQLTAEDEVKLVVKMDFRLFLEEYEHTYEFFGKRCDEMRKYVLGNTLCNLEEKVNKDFLPPGCMRI